MSMQDGLSNLRDLLRADLSDIVRFVTNPPSGLIDFKRIAAQFGVGGTITALTGVSINFIVHYDHKDSHQNNDAGGRSPTGTATAVLSSSLPTPTEWLLNTVPGTSVDAFEAFIKKLPDRGSGERIVFPQLDHQHYVGKMTLEEAKAVSKILIVDQITPNDPLEYYTDRMKDQTSPQDGALSSSDTGPPRIEALSSHDTRSRHQGGLSSPDTRSRHHGGLSSPDTRPPLLTR